MFTVFKYFLSFRIFEQLVLALKTEFALKFFKPGEAAAPPPMISSNWRWYLLQHIVHILHFLPTQVLGPLAVAQSAPLLIRH